MLLQQKTLNHGAPTGGCLDSAARLDGAGAPALEGLSGGVSGQLKAIKRLKAMQAPALFITHPAPKIGHYFQARHPQRGQRQPTATAMSHHGGAGLDSQGAHVGDFGAGALPDKALRWPQRHSGQASGNQYAFTNSQARSSLIMNVDGIKPEQISGAKKFQNCIG